MRPDLRALPAGTRIDRYELLSPLGAGGFGAVYRARHLQLGHDVALKLLHQEHTSDEELLERFFREARAATAIGSRHIAQVLDVGTSTEGWHFLAMELLVGASLEEVLADHQPPRPLPTDRAVAIGLQILESLAEAHAVRIIHRDLKPANVFLARLDDGSEVVKLLDFGVSKIIDHQQAALTQSGEMLGTPLYMAPEQFHNARDVDHRVDLYSAAAVLYEMLSTRVPFEAESYADLVVQVCCEQVRPLQVIAPQVPRPIADVVMRGLAQVPEVRWPDACAFAAALCSASGLRLPPTFDCDGVTPVPLGTDPSEIARGTVPASPLPPQSLPSTEPVALRGPPTAPPPQPVMAEPTPGRRSPPPVARGSGPSGRRLLVLLIALPLGFLVFGVVVGGGVAALRLLSSEEAAPPPPAPALTSPAPAPTPTVSTPGPTPPLSIPGLSSSSDDPFGQIVSTVLGSMSDGLAGQASSPMSGDPSTGVQLSHPRIVGQLDQAAVEQVLRGAQRPISTCRPQGAATTVQLQVHVAFTRISMITPMATDAAPAAVTQCVRQQLEASIPAGWSPGDNGIIFLTFGLQPR